MTRTWGLGEMCPRSGVVHQDSLGTTACSKDSLKDIDKDEVPPAGTAATPFVPG